MRWQGGLKDKGMAGCGWRLGGLVVEGVHLLGGEEGEGVRLWESLHTGPAVSFLLPEDPVTPLPSPTPLRPEVCGQSLVRLSGAGTH